MGVFGKSLSISVSGSRSSDDTDGSCVKAFCQMHVKTIVTLFLIFGTFLVIVMLVYAHKWRFEGEQAAAAAACLDVAIIGAGVSGTFTAWKLREKGLRVQLFEMSERIGGRFYSRSMPDMPDIHAELGAMYFSPQQHPLINQTVHALGLKTKRISAGSEADATFYLRGVHLKQSELISPKLPYNLNAQEKYRYPYQLKRGLLRTLQNASDALHNPLGVKTDDGSFLYEHGYWNWLGHVASVEAYNYLSDTSQYRSVVTNANAALLATMNTENIEQEFMTLSGGFDSLPKEMVRRFLEADKRKHRYVNNHKLHSVIYSRGMYTLNFTLTCTRNGVTQDLQKYSTTCARKVILALPPRALRKIRFPFLTPHGMARFQQTLETVKEVPSLKMFFSYKYRWWLQGKVKADHIATDLPNRRVFYVGSHSRDGGSDKNSLLLVAYPDDTDVSYWQGLYSGQPFPMSMSSASNVNVTRSMVDHVTLQLRAMFKVPDDTKSEADLPYSAVVQDWTTDPYGAGWHLWKPGVNWDEIARRLLKPFCEQDIFIVGSAFCPGKCQMVAEGALQTVLNLLRKYFFLIE